MANVAILKNFETPKEAGQYYRLLCLNGRAKGVSYFILGRRVLIGRADSTDIQVFDIKSSREHAEVTKAGKDVFITDLGSQNGISVNDKKVKQSKLKDGDKVVIGQTVFKFGVVEVKGPKLKVVDDDFEEEEDEKPKRKNPIILILIVLAAAYFLMGEDEGNSPKENAKNKSIFKSKVFTDDFSKVANKKKHLEDKETAKKMRVIFQNGLREFREGNYFRAMNEFKRALIVKPDDSQASFYLRKAKDSLDDLIKQHFDKGDRDFGSLKYQGSMVEYCAVIRVLQNYPEDDRYKRAEDKIREIEKILGMDKGEIKCIKE